MCIGVRSSKTLGVVLRSLSCAVGGGEPVRFLSKGDCSGSIVARQTTRKVGKSLMDVSLGSGVEEGAQGLLAKCIRCSLSRDAPRQSKGAQIRSSETYMRTEQPEKATSSPGLWGIPGRAEGRHNALTMVSVGHLTCCKLRTATVSSLSPRALEETFLGTLTNPRGSWDFPPKNYSATCPSCGAWSCTPHPCAEG